MKIIFKTYYNQGDSRTLCHLFKEGSMEAIHIMAERMSLLVPSESILIPVPSRYGYATNTLILANEIARISGSPVADILKGVNRESNYIAKKQGHPLHINDLGFYKTGDTSLTPCFVDNVIDTGVTMNAALKVFGYGVGLVYSRSTRVDKKQFPSDGIIPYFCLT